MTIKGTTPYTLKERDGKTIAHAVAFDLVAVGKDYVEAVESLAVLVEAQIRAGSGLVGDTFSLMNVFFAAPREYWEPPFYDMPFDVTV